MRLFPSSFSFLLFRRFRFHFIHRCTSHAYIALRPHDIVLTSQSSHRPDIAQLVQPWFGYHWTGNVTLQFKSTLKKREITRKSNDQRIMDVEWFDGPATPSNGVAGRVGASWPSGWVASSSSVCSAGSAWSRWGNMILIKSSAL